MIFTRKQDIIRLHNTQSAFSRFLEMSPKKKACSAKCGTGFCCGLYYRKMYFRMKRTAKMYIRGVTFLALPVTTFRITKEMMPREIPSEML